MSSSGTRRGITANPLLWVLLVYVCGIAIRLIYTLSMQRPDHFDLFGHGPLRRAGPPDRRADAARPGGRDPPAGLLGVPRVHDDERLGLARAVYVQLVVSCLVPLAIGLLGAAAYGRRTGLLAVVFASLYFPFIEYGALFLSEIHFVFWLALAFAGLFGARRVRRPAAAIGICGGGGVRLVDRRVAEVGRAARRGAVLLRRRGGPAAGPPRGRTARRAGSIG